MLNARTSGEIGSERKIRGSVFCNRALFEIIEVLMLEDAASMLEDSKKRRVPYITYACMKEDKKKKKTQRRRALYFLARPP